jgi:hypothetical protein
MESVTEKRDSGKTERKGYACFDAKWLARVAPFATPHLAFTNPNYPGVIVEPHPAGKGIQLTATDGHVLVRAYDPDGNCSAPLHISTPKALIRACREPKGPKLTAPHMFGYRGPGLPDYLRPGKVIVDVIVDGDGKRHMEMVLVAAKAQPPDDPQSEGGFYAMTSATAYKDEPIASVSKGSGWTEKVLAQATADGEPTTTLIASAYYLRLIGKLACDLRCAATFTFHGSAGPIGFMFDLLDGGSIVGGLMPMLRGDDSDE